MYKKYRNTKPLPKISLSIKPSESLKRKIYNEEVFDCIKKNIQSSETKAPNQQRLPSARKLLKSERRELTRTTRLEILKEYPPERLEQFKTKNKRRAIRSNFRSEFEFNLFCNICKEHNSKKYARWTKRRERLTLRRKKEKKGAKHSKYTTYINSKVWERRRNDFWKKHSRRCAVCDTAKFIHLHHMDYSSMGNEPDEHLVALCKEHHAQYHKENGVSRHMIRTTHAFIEKERAKLYAS